MKKFAALIIMVFFISTSAPAAFAETYEDGVYTASHSFVTVELVISEGQIESVKIADHGGGGERYCSMIEPLTEEVLSAQSAEVDTVTGATVSSRHFIKAVNKALEEAKS